MLALLLWGRERTRSYSVHETAAPAGDRVQRAEALVFVKDGFVLPAFLLPPLWLASQGVWLGVLAYGAAMAAVVGLAALFGVPTIGCALLALAIHLVFGFEADEMQRAHLAARGWTMVGQVTGTGPLDCERRFFDHWLPSVPMTALVDKAQPTAALTRQSALQPRAAVVLGNLLAPLRRRT